MRILLIVCLALLTWQVPAQTRNNFPNDGRNCKLTILAEFHGIEGLAERKGAMTERLYDEANVKDIVLEAGRAMVYLWNEYLETGDEAIPMLLYAKSSKTGFLQELRKIYAKGKNIQLHGIDFERPDALLAIQYLMEKKGKTDNELYRYISSQKKTIAELRKNDRLRKERQQMMEACEKIYRTQQAYYDEIKDGDFSVKAVFDNPGSEMKFAKRDAAMTENMLPILAQAKGNVLLIAGTNHIEDNGKLYKKLTKDAGLERKNVRIISMLAKDCSPRAMYFEPRKVPYLGYKTLVNDTAAAGKIIAKYHMPEQLSIVRTDGEFFKEFGLKPDEEMDYVLLMECQ